MNVLMVRAKVKAAQVTELEAAVKRVFAALQQEQPKGIRYASGQTLFQCSHISFG